MCYSVTRKGNDAARSVNPHSERFLFDAPLISLGRLNVPFIQHSEYGFEFLVNHQKGRWGGASAAVPSG